MIGIRGDAPTVRTEAFAGEAQYLRNIAVTVMGRSGDAKIFVLGGGVLQGQNAVAVYRRFRDHGRLATLGPAAPTGFDSPSRHQLIERSGRQE